MLLTKVDLLGIAVGLESFGDTQNGLSSGAVSYSQLCVHGA